MSKPKVWRLMVDGRDKVLVCATSQRAAIELLARCGLFVSERYLRDYASVTGSAAECRLATEPGVWQELASGWRRVI